MIGFAGTFPFRSPGMRPTCAGTLLLCDGTCMRAFHGGVAEGDDGKWEPLGCNPLGCSRELFAHIQASNEPFECPNCLARVHQCFVCKKEGASDSSKGPQEVFRCAAHTRALVQYCGGNMSCTQFAIASST